MVEDHHGGVRRGLGDARDRLEARTAGHVEVEHQDGRLVTEDEALGRVHVAGLRHHLHVLLRLE
jgi:hypothetical protein